MVGREVSTAYNDAEGNCNQKINNMIPNLNGDPIYNVRTILDEVLSSLHELASTSVREK